MHARKACTDDQDALHVECLLLVWPTRESSCAARSASWERTVCGERSLPHLQHRSSLDEREQVGVDHVGMSGAHAMRELLVDLERDLPQQFRGQQCGGAD